MRGAVALLLLALALPIPGLLGQEPPAVNPGLLDRPLEPVLEPIPVTPAETILQAADYGRPTGYAGPSRIPNRHGASADFEPVEDRWRIGYPEYDRYGKGFPVGEDYLLKRGSLLDPFNQNYLKGDYPIYGQDIFFVFTAISESVFEGRQLPTATTLESTNRPGQSDFFGKPNSFHFDQLLEFSFELFRGDASFKPVDWRVKIAPAFNLNYLAAQELGVTNVDVSRGRNRGRTWATLQEWFAEYKIADLSPEYDFISIRAGSQPFTSDFRGFIFSDTNRAVRLFGNLESNRDQYNLIFFRQQEKDTDSGLNSFKDRDQTVIIANFYRQDFIFPGYTAEASVHYNNDAPTLLFDRNNFLVRPDPAGVFQQHRVESVYLGWAGDGHIDSVNISHAFYWALGTDSLNPIAGRKQDINAQMAALEISYDRDWARFRVSGLWQSGDGNPNNRHATGFDSILDNQNFAGGEFSFFQRQGIPLFGVNLTQPGSLLVDLRSSKTQGQSNFVNPGLQLVNLGFDADITPKLKSINNVNYLWFDKTAVLQTFVFQGRIDREIGVDISTGLEYRPLLSNNIILTAGIASLIPSNGFKQLYNNSGGNSDHIDPLLAAFLVVRLQY